MADSGDDPTDGIEVVVTAATPVLQARLVGVLDITGESALLDAAGPALAEGVTRVELDCSDLRFCDSGGLRALVLLRNAVGDDGEVALTNPTPTLVRVLEVTGLDGPFQVGPAQPA